jgi:putative inorganic carbon (hco3(-)) transporter
LILEDFKLHINSNVPASGFKLFQRQLKQKLLIEKFNGWQGFLVFSIAATAIAIMVANGGMTPGIMLVALMVGVPVVYFLIVKPEFGIMVYLNYAYTMMLMIRYGINAPLGTIMDGFMGLFILGIFIHMKKKREWELFKNPISTVILIWVGYNIFEVVNPAAASRMSWLGALRTVALVALYFFVFLLHVRTRKFLYIIVKWWLLVSMINACYAFKQEYIGFFDFEQRYLDSDPNIGQLLFLAGHWRKFSMMSDPVTFAYNMAMASLLCMGLISGPIKFYKKLILGFMALFFLNAMLFSGTRGAFPLVPIALMLYAILKFNKQVMIFTGLGLLFVVFLIFMPSSNQNILRFQSAFRPNEDASYMVRKRNQARIKPFIYSHPIGGGLGATEYFGQKYAPGSYLAHFPPDSGYVRVTVELGPIGLIIFCIMIFVILKTGINNYYSIRDPKLKALTLALLLVIFAWNIGNFPQEAFVQYPSNVLFFLTVALVVITKRLDDEQNLLADAKQ